MPGIAQVWLTAEELEALAEALDRDFKTYGPGTKHLIVGRDKIETALGPVACKVASGPKTHVADLTLARRYGPNG